jgi:hypothetical protein
MRKRRPHENTGKKVPDSGNDNFKDLCNGKKIFEGWTEPGQAPKVTEVDRMMGENQEMGW